MAVNFESFFNAGEQAFVIIDFQIRMNASLHQDARAAERDGFFDLLVDHMIGQHVRFRIALDAVERTEGAKFLTNVRVVDVPIDDVADHVIRMASLAYAVGAHGQIEQIRLFKKTNGFLRSDPHAIRGRIQERPDISHTNCGPRTDLSAPACAAFS